MSERHVDVLCGGRGRTPCGFLDGVLVVYMVMASEDDVRGIVRWDPLKCLINISQIIETPMTVCATSTRTRNPTWSPQ